MKRRLIALAMAVLMCVQVLPVGAFAAVDPDTNLCEHHTQHSAEVCGYVEGTPGAPCQHQCGDGCYAAETTCVHAHSDVCCQVSEVGELLADTCTHQCSEESGCVTRKENCAHSHDSECGYAEAATAVPCQYECAQCAEGDAGENAAQEAPAGDQNLVSLAEVDDCADGHTPEYTANWDGTHSVSCSVCYTVLNEVEDCVIGNNPFVGNEKSFVSCKSPAVYFKACVCGYSLYDETFESGDKDPNAHTENCTYIGNGDSSHQKHWPCCGVTSNTPEKCVFVDGKCTDCGDHKHEWATEYTYDDTHHWQECTAPECDISEDSQKQNYGEHSYENGVCKCGVADPSVIYIVAGDPELCTSNWNQADEANKMTWDESTGVYTKTYENVQPHKNIQFKVVKDESEWIGDATGNNVTFSIISPCNVTVTFDPVTKEITVTGDSVELGEALESVYAVGGGTGNWLNGLNWYYGAAENRLTETSEGIYQITYHNIPASKYPYNFKFASQGTWTWGGTFAGFGKETAAEFGGDTIEFSQEAESDITLTLDLRSYDPVTHSGAKFTVSRTYSLNFDANGGTGAPGAQNCTEGPDNAVISWDTIPTRKGHTFLGWAMNKDATAPDCPYNTQDTTPATFTITANTTLYAVWQDNRHTCGGRSYDTAWSGSLAETYITESADIYLSGDVTAAGQIFIFSGVTVNLCLNGHTLDLGRAYIENSGTLNIYDCSASGTGRITTILPETIYNSGTLNLYGGTVANTGTSGYEAIYNFSGNITIYDGSVTSTGTYGIEHLRGTLDVLGGSVTGADYGIRAYDSVYLAGAPTIGGGKGSIFLDAQATYGEYGDIYASSAGWSTPYSGERLTLGLSAEFKVGHTVVYGVTGDNEGKFSVSGAMSLKRDGNDLALAVHSHDGTTYDTAWSGSMEKTDITADTNIVLAGDTVLSGSLTISEGVTVNLCLNGCTLNMGSNFIQSHGTLNICDCKTGGTITGTDHAEFILNYGKLNLSSGNIQSSGSGGYAITNGGTMTMSGGTVESASSHAIYNIDTLTVSGGTVSALGTKAAIFNGGACTLTGTAKVSGKSLGVQNTYTLQLSGNAQILSQGEGHISVSSNSVLDAIDGQGNPYAGDTLILVPEDGYVPQAGDVIVQNAKAEDQKFSLAGGGILIQGTGTNANHLVAAHSHDETIFDTVWGGPMAATTITENANIVLTGDTTFTGTLIIGEGVTVNLCLNGQTLDVGTNQFVNNGTLTICDCEGNGKITANRRDSCISNSGSLTLKSGTVENQLNGYSIRNNGGTLAIQGGTVTCPYTAIRNDAPGTLTVSGGSILSTSTSDGIINYGTASITGGKVSGYNGVTNTEGTLTVSGQAVISGEENAIYNTASCTVSGGTIQGAGNYGKGIYNPGGTLTVTGGSISGKYGIQIGGGAADVSNANITSSTGYGISISNDSSSLILRSGTVSGYYNGIEHLSGTTTILGGTVESGEKSQHAVYVQKGTLFVKGGTITSEGPNAVGISAANAGVEVHISGGSVSGTSYSVRSSGSVYLSGEPALPNGIKLGGSSAIYAKDGENVYSGDPLAVTLDWPNNFLGRPLIYDGTAIQDTFSLTNPGYSLVPCAGDQAAHLELGFHVHDGVNYSTLWKGSRGGITISADANIVLTGDTTFSGNLIIGEGVTVNLCLNGHKLDLGANQFENNGTLIIRDHQEGTGLITSESTYGVFNGGALTLWNGSITGARIGIYCASGEVAVKGGTVTGTADNGINLIGGCKAEISGGVIQGKNSGIYAEGDCQITGGTVTGTGAGITQWKGRLTVSGGSTLIRGGYGIMQYGSYGAEATVSGGTVESTVSTSHAIETRGGKLTVSGDAVVKSPGGYGIKGEGKASITVSGGTVDGRTGGLYITGEGSVAMVSGGTLTGACGLLIGPNATAKVSGGELTGTDYGIAVGGRSYTTNNGTLYLSGSPAVSGEESDLFLTGTGGSRIYATAEMDAATPGYEGQPLRLEMVIGQWVEGMVVVYNGVGRAEKFSLKEQSGWQLAAGVNEKANHLVLAEQKLNVTFDANGGDGTVPSPAQTVLYGGYPAVKAPWEHGLTRDGYTFMGWSTNPLYAELVSEGTDDQIGWFDNEDFLSAMGDAEYFPIYADNTVLYAIWAENVLDVNGDGKGDYPLLAMIPGAGSSITKAKVLKDYTDGTGLYLEDGATFHLDLNNHTVTNVPCYTDESSSLTISNGTLAGEISYIDIGGSVVLENLTLTEGPVMNYGSLTIRGGSYHGLMIMEGSETVLESGTFYPTKPDGVSIMVAPDQSEDTTVLKQILLSAPAIGKKYSLDESHVQGAEYGFAAFMETVRIVKDTITGITATGSYKKDYVYGEPFDSNGIVVTATYESGRTAPVTALYDHELSVGQTSITLSYTEDGVTHTCEVDITVSKKTLDVSGIAWEVTDFTYDGMPKRIRLTGDLPAGVKVTTSGDTATDAGSYTADAVFSLKDGYSSDNYSITGAGDENRLTAPWRIREKALADYTIVLEYREHPYTGQDLTPTVTLKDGETVIPAGEYTVSYRDNRNVGTATVTITDNPGGNYSLTGKDDVFTVTSAKITGLSIIVKELTYTGEAQTASVEATARAVDGAEVAFTYSTDENGEYSTQFPAFTDAGKHRVYFKASAANHADRTGSFTVEIRQADNAWITDPAISGWTYGESQEPVGEAAFGTVEFTWYDSGKTELSGKPVDAGSYFMVASVPSDGRNYSGVTTGYIGFTIAKAQLTPEIQLTANTKVYDGTTGVTGASIVLTGAVNGEQPKAEASAYAYNSANVAEAVKVTATGITLRGGWDKNYALARTTAEIPASIIKQTVEAPVIPGKTYNGSNQTADVAASELYLVQENKGGIAKGSYNVVLKLTDSANYQWSSTEAPTVTLTFVIGPGKNAWTLEPAISGWTYGEPKEPVGEAKFGTVEFTWYDSGKTKLDEKPENAGSYFMVASVPADGDNYPAMTTEYLGFTIEKALVSEPVISGKAYTGQKLTADITDTDLYTVEENNGGIARGSYDVVLKLTDSANYQWSSTEAPTVTLTFVIASDKNAWTLEPAISGWTYGEPKEPVGTAKFGTVNFTWYDSGKTKLDEKPEDAGSYFMVASVPADGDNYTAIQTDFIGFTIEKARLTPVVQLESTSKVYDGTTKASGASIRLEGAVNGEQPKAEASSYAYNSANVAEADKVTATGIVLDAPWTANYALTADTAETKASITKAPLTPAIQLTQDSKPYDGTTSVTGASIVLTGAAGSELPTAEAAQYAYNSANVAEAKTITAVGIHLTSTWGENYELTANTAQAAATVTKAAVPVPSIPGKPYTGSIQTADIVDTNLYTVEENNGGTAKGSYPVVLKLTDSANYQWAGSDGDTVTLDFVIGQGENAWTLEPAISGWTYGDPKEPVGTAKFGTVNFTWYDSTKRLLKEKPVNAGSYYMVASVPANGDNYAAIQTDYLGFTIEKARLTPEIQLTATSKVYDGTTNVTGASIRLTGAVGNEQPTAAAASYAYNSANVAEARMITATGIVLNAPWTANYALTADTASIAAAITKAAQTAPALGEGYTIDYAAETITVADGYEASTAKADGDAVASGAAVTPGATLYIRKVEKANFKPSDWTVLPVASRPAAPLGITAKDETILGKADGGVSGITADMEYKLGDGTWTSGTGKDLTGLGESTVLVRIKATADAPHGVELTVKVKAGPGLTVTFDSQGGSAVEAVTGIAYNTAIAPPAAPAKDGYSFGGWYADEACTQAYDFSTKVTESFVLYAKWVKVEYTIIQGAGQTVTKGNKAVFVSDADFSKFVSVQVDGTALNREDYTAENGSTKVTLTAAYINTLTTGGHSLSIVSSDGSASTTFTVKNKPAPTNPDIPGTGDDEQPILWIALFVLSSFGVLAALPVKRKKEK